ncbi:transcription initiation factor TFIIIB [Clostridium botulinum]|nr:transcription initiation factor TFIIIB [Clostridium botulinum]
MENNKKCPICGCEEIGEGKLESYMAPTDGSWLSSKVIADICTKCGYILAMRVKIQKSLKTKK